MKINRVLILFCTVFVCITYAQTEYTLDQDTNTSAPEDEACTEFCGNTPNVKCVNFGNYLSCDCTQKDKTFINKKEGCRNQDCADLCGRATGVKCNSDEGSLTCGCSDGKGTYINKEEGCRTKVCTDVCGTSLSVKCDEKGTYLKCICSDGNGTFINKQEGCRSKACTDQCGRAAGVKCDGSESSLFCSCMDETGTYIGKGEGCRSKACTDECGVSPGIRCNTLRIPIICKCLGALDVFVNKDKGCREQCSKNKDCKNGGECIETSGKKICKCRNGTIGDFCQYVTACQSQKFKFCKGDNGTCEFDNKSNETVCKCKQKKQFDEEINECRETCDDDKCENGAACIADASETKFCRCREGSRGDFCGVVDACKTEKFKYCKEENGTCVLDADSNGTLCECSHNKEFDNKKNECRETCDEDECKNGGQCIADESDTKFCRCRQGTSGNFCDIVDECETKKFIYCKRDNGTCMFDVESNATVCKCNHDKVFDDKLNVCSDPCLSNPCKNGGTCKVKEGKRMCECKPSYTGADCDKAIDKCILKYRNNECNKLHEICESGECRCENNYAYSKDKVKCIENFCNKACPPNSQCKEHESGKYFECTCNIGYFMQKGKCMKINLCDPGVSQCKQICNENTGVCGCYPGFNLDTSDNATCIPKDEDTDCQLDCGVGVCIKNGNTYECLCPPIGFVFRDNTCMDICTANGRVAPYGSCPSTKCEPDGHYGFRCLCEDPYEEDDDDVHCKRKVMCDSSKAQDDCDKKAAKCVEDPKDEKKGYRCECEDGYEEVNGVCTNKCEMKEYIQMCSKQAALCSLDYNYEVKCVCPPLFTREIKGGSCNMIARNSFLGHLHILKNKYEAEINDRRSTDIMDLKKLSKDILESLENVYRTNKDVKILSCSDNNEQSLITCSVELQFESKSTNVNIISNPSICLPLDDEYCWIKPNLIMKRADNEQLFNPIDPCSEVVTANLCGKDTNCTTGNRNDFQCRCKEGFYPLLRFNPVKSKKTFIEKCGDIDECQDPSKCPDNTYCLNIPGSYSCHCKDGFKRKSSDSDPKIDGCKALCDPNPCLNDAECIKIGNHGFSCKCKDSYVGTFCNETSNIIAKKNAPDKDNLAIVGGILGALLVIAVISGCILYSKMKKYKKDVGYTSDNQRNAPSEMTERGRRQQRDIELNSNSQRPGTSRRDSGEYRRHYSGER